MSARNLVHARLTELCEASGRWRLHTGENVENLAVPKGPEERRALYYLVQVRRLSNAHATKYWTFWSLAVKFK